MRLSTGGTLALQGHQWLRHGEVNPGAESWPDVLVRSPTLRVIDPPTTDKAARVGSPTIYPTVSATAADIDRNLVKPSSSAH